MGKVEEKKIQKRNALLRSAYELFTTVGFHKTPVLAIALKAGVSKGSFYNYFDDKADIRDTLIIQKSEELLQEALGALADARESAAADCPALPGCSPAAGPTAAAGSAPSPAPLAPEDKLVFLLDYILDKLSGDLDLLRFISKNLSWGLFKNSGKYHAGSQGESIDFRIFIAGLLQEDGIQPNKNIELAIFTIIELVNSTCYSVILSEEPVSLKEYKPYLYDCVRRIFCSGLAAGARTP